MVKKGGKSGILMSCMRGERTAITDCWYIHRPVGKQTVGISRIYFSPNPNCFNVKMMLRSLLMVVRKYMRHLTLMFIEAFNLQEIFFKLIRGTREASYCLSWKAAFSWDLHTLNATLNALSPPYWQTFSKSYTVQLSWDISWPFFLNETMYFLLFFWRLGLSATERVKKSWSIELQTNTLLLDFS